MSTIVTRAGKGTPLTNNEVDANFTNLNNDKLEVEVNDLTTSVTWDDVPDAYITASSVTQHETALTITESQISDLQNYLTQYTETDPVFSAHVASGVTATNISNWNTAYNNHITAVNYTGSTLTLTQQDGGILETTINGALGTELSLNGDTKIEAVVGGVEVTGDITVTGTVDGRDLATDGTKLDGIETNATADQTGAEIKTAYEAEADTNAFTDAEKNKLNGIEASATADQTGAEIKTAYEAESDTNAFTDSEKTKLSGIEANATADQTDAEIKTAYENNADTNAFTDADHSKLDGIEANADVTDTANVTAAGAVMDGDFTSAGFMKTDGSGTYSTDNSTYLTSFDITTQTDPKYLRSDTADTASGFIQFASGFTSSSGSFTGNVTVSGTVDGRDLSVDGAKLDSLTSTLTSNYQDGMQWAQGANRALTTTLTQYGDTLFVKHSGDTYKTYVDLSVDLIHSSTSGTNDAYGHLAVVAPSPSSEPTINMGTCTAFSSGISYIAAFSISGDWTEYFSPYVGLSKNSDGSSPMSSPYKWVYNPYANTTTVWVSLYINAPATGDTIYLHPFDWESTGTVINGETLRLDGSSDTAVDNRRDFKIYLGRFDSRVGYKFLAKENASTDVVTLDTLRMFTTEYEV